MKINKLRKILYVVLASLFLVAIVQGLFVEPVATMISSENRIAEESQWQIESSETPEGRLDTYRLQIPENLGDELVFCMRSYNAAIEVWLDDEQIYTYHNDFGSRGICWKWVELPKNAPGRRLTLQIHHRNKWVDQVAVDNVFLGDQNSVFLRILKRNLFVLLDGSFTILLGLLACMGAWMLRGKLAEDARRGLAYLGVFITLSGVWMITDSSILQFVTGRTTAITVLSFGSFMLMPYFMLRFIRKMMVYPTKRLMRVAHLHLINAAVCIILYLLRIASLQQTLLSSHVLLVISVVIMLREEIREIRVHHNREMKIILQGMIQLLVFLVLAFTFFYLNPGLRYSVFYGIGILIFEYALVRAAFTRIYYYLDTRMQAEEYRQIAYRDSLTQLENRLAFSKQQERGSFQENRSCVVFDINNLKKVNDAEGHLAGDQLIMDAGKCILEAFGELGHCYRIGGDEFAVISNTASAEKILEAIAMLEQVVKKVNMKRSMPLEIACGYAVRESEAQSVQELFRAADAHMYARKHEMKQEMKQESK